MFPAYGAICVIFERAGRVDELRKTREQLDLAGRVSRT